MSCTRTLKSAISRYSSTHRPAPSGWRVRLFVDGFAAHRCCFAPPGCSSSQTHCATAACALKLAPFNRSSGMVHLSFTRRLRHLLLAATVAWASHAMATTPAQFDGALAQFQQARTGDAAAIGSSAQAFAALLKAEPINPVLMAYAGASTAMQATTTWLPWSKMAYAEDGLALLDKALTLLTPAHNAPLLRGLPAT